MKGRPPHRPWAGFWTWRDKPVAERGAADVILRQAKFQVAQLKSRRDDPPDCEAMLDRRWSAIEVTELVHEQALAQSMKALKERSADRAPDLLRALQDRISVKDVLRLKGGPYERYVLVIYTDELVLDGTTVDRFLKGATFHGRSITDVVVGVSHEQGSYPVFRLRLTWL